MTGKFVTIVPHIENLELRKDTGQIPYHFYKTLGYDSYLVSYFYTLEGGRSAGPVAIPPTSEEEIESNYPFLKSEVKGLKMHFLPYEGRGKFYEKSIFSFLKKEARNISILNLFHLTSENIFYTFLYKSLNPTGKVYLKLDIDIAYYETRDSLFNVGGTMGGIKSKFYNMCVLPLFFKLVNLLSAESEAGKQYFIKRFKINPNKVSLIPNGIDSQRINSLIPQIRNYSEKEDIIISVGRIGNVQKNHQILLDAIVNLDLKNWKVYFIGPIEAGFQPAITRFFEQNPHYKDQVIFIGNVKDPGELYSFYNRSKIFCMPSQWEGFPLAAVEAAYFGNVLVLSSGIYAFDTLTNFGQGGEKFNPDDKDELSLILGNCIEDDQKIKEKQLNISTYAKMEFLWSTLVKQINSKLIKA